MSDDRQSWPILSANKKARVMFTMGDEYLFGLLLCDVYFRSLDAERRLPVAFCKIRRLSCKNRPILSADKIVQFYRPA